MHLTPFQAVLTMKKIFKVLALSLASLLVLILVFVDAPVGDPNARFDRIVSIFAQHGVRASGVDEMIEEEVGFRGIGGYIQLVSESMGSRALDGKVVSFDISPSASADYVGKVVGFKANYEERGFFENDPNLSRFEVTGLLDESQFKLIQCSGCGGEGRQRIEISSMIEGDCDTCKLKGITKKAYKRRDEGFTYQYCNDCCSSLNLDYGMGPVLIKKEKVWRDCVSCGGGGTIVGPMIEAEEAPNETAAEGG